jgi:tetratricopeptide (TPR) repeat protein
LIDNGVKAVVVAGWAVDDAAALAFAKKFYQCMFDGESFGEAVRKARENIYTTHGRKNTWGAYQCYGDPYYSLRQGSGSKKEKNYVIPAQAEIDLSNLRSDLTTGELNVKYASDKLKEISDETDKRGIRTPAITESEAMIYTALNNYKSAIEKFEQLLASPDASYSFTAAEQYCNIRAKYLAAQISIAKPPANLEKDFDKLISDLDALIQLSPSAERYSIIGSAWKRKLALYKKNKTKTIQALAQSCRNYHLAYLQGKNIEGAYPYTNWFALETILVIAGERKWGQSVLDNDKKEIYSLPAVPDILEMLRDMENSQLKKQADKYWDRILIPNIRLCTWMLLATTDKKLKQMPDSRKVKDSYLKVWKMTGTKDEKEIEIQHLDLLIEALTLIVPKHFLLTGLKDLKEKLKTAIGE